MGNREKIDSYLNKKNCYGQLAYEKQTKNIKTIQRRTSFIRRNKNAYFETERQDFVLWPELEGYRKNKCDIYFFDLPKLDRCIVLTVNYDECEIFNPRSNITEKNTMLVRFERRLYNEIRGCELQVFQGENELEKIKLNPSDNWQQNLQSLVENFIAYDFACKNTEYYLLQRLPFTEVTNLSKERRSEIKEDTKYIKWQFRKNLECTFDNKFESDSQAELNDIFGKDAIDIEKTLKENIDAALKIKEVQTRDELDAKILKKGRLMRAIKKGIASLTDKIDDKPDTKNDEKSDDDEHDDFENS